MRLPALPATAPAAIARVACFGAFLLSVPPAAFAQADADGGDGAEQADAAESADTESQSGDSSPLHPNCPSDDSPWIRIRVSDVLAGVSGSAVLDHLRVGLEALDIQACAASSNNREKQPIAILSISADATGDAMLAIRVTDAVTVKRVERIVSLDGVPADTRALAIAAAADELLRATWTEIKLSRRPQAAPPRDQPVTPPAQVERAVQSATANVSPARSPSAKYELVAGIGSSFFPSGHLDVGPTLALRRSVAAGYAIGLRASYRWSAERRVTQGVLDATLLTAGAQGSLRLLEDTRWLGALTLGVDVGWLEYSPRAEPNFRAEAADTLVMLVSAGAKLSRHLDSLLWASAAMRGLWATQGAEATDGDARVAAFSGPGLEMQLALEVRF